MPVLDNNYRSWFVYYMCELCTVRWGVVPRPPHTYDGDNKILLHKKTKNKKTTTSFLQLINIPLLFPPNCELPIQNVN